MFECIKKLAKALGPLFARHAQSLLDAMFSHKLTEGLKRAVDAIIRGVPVLAPDIKGEHKDRVLCHMVVTFLDSRAPVAIIDDDAVPEAVRAPGLPRGTNWDISAGGS